MELTIAHLVSIVSKAESEKAASIKISEKFNKISPRSALVIVKDVKDYMSEKITKENLSLFLFQAGLSK